MRSARAMLSLDPSGHAVPVDDMTSVTAIAGRSPVGRRMLALFLLVAVFHSGHGSCYFPIHYQGVYVMQSTIGSGGNSQPVQYSQVNITEDAIPIWGHCEKRVGNNNYILVDSYKGTTCIRCINLKLRAPNVIRVHTAEGPQKCYTQQESAEATCPSENDLQYHDNLKDIILYKTKESSGTDARKDYCPIDGRYSFRYALNDGSGGATTECSSPTSLADNCPRGHQLNLRFSGCSFEDRVFAYECLANWEGPGKQRYLALYDTRLGGERRPLYRCALYEEVSPGVIHMALSSDSTCSTDLKNASSGFESFVLTARPSPPLPPQVHMSSCKFPDWAQGSWQNLHVNGNTMVYRDTDMFWTLTWRCIDTTMDNRATDKFLVHGRTQCGEEVHSCLLLKRRGPNVLEFITGQHLSENFNASLCADSNFLSMNWITQGRTDGAQVSPCPIMGDYTGMLPDGEGLCAELASDCDALETMHYTVSECSTSEIYEGFRRSNVRRIRDASSLTKSLGTSSSQPAKPNPTVPWTMSESTSSWPSTTPTVYSTTQTPSFASSETPKNTSPSLPEMTKPSTTTTTRQQTLRSSTEPSSTATTSTPTQSSSQTIDYSTSPSSRATTISTSISGPTTVVENTSQQVLKAQSTSPSSPSPASSTQQSRSDYSTGNEFGRSPSSSRFSQPTTDYNLSRSTPQGQINGFNNFSNGYTQSSGIPIDYQRSGSRQMSGFNNSTPSGQMQPAIHPNGVPQTMDYSNRPSSTDFQQRQSTNPGGYQSSGQYPLQQNTGFRSDPSHNYQPSTQSRPTYQQIGPDYSGQSPPHYYDQQYHHQPPYHGRAGNSPDYYSGGGSQHPQTYTNSNNHNYQTRYQTPADDRYHPYGTNSYQHSSYMPDGQTIGRRTDTHGNPPPPPAVYQGQQPVDPRTTYNIQGGGGYSPFGYVTPQMGQRYHNQSASTNNYYQRDNWNGGGQTFVGDPMNVNGYHKAATTTLGEKKTPIALPPIQLPSQTFAIRMPQASSRVGNAGVFQPKRHREERDYQCLGQWEENGLTYTYARRKDANTYECFVGSIVTEGELLLTEAGRHCTRNVDPYKTGMKLIKKGVCDTAKKTGSGSTSFVPVASTQGSLFPVQSSTPRSSYTAIPKRLPSSTMKPWKPITAQGMPPLKNRNTSPPNGTSTITLNLMMAIIAVLVTYTLNQ